MRSSPPPLWSCSRRPTALTIDVVPFTRAYEPEHARLKTRWPLYVFGLYLSAIWPARMELRMLRDSTAIAPIVAAWLFAVAALEWWGRRRAAHWRLDRSTIHPMHCRGCAFSTLEG